MAKGKASKAPSKGKGQTAVDETVSQPEQTGGNSATEGPATDSAGKEQGTVELTFKENDKRGRNAIFTGAAVQIRIPLSAFVDSKAPATWPVPDNIFAARKAKLTKEQRAEARKNAPKPTLADRVAEAEKKAAKLREKLAKANADAAQAPAPETVNA